MNSFIDAASSSFLPWLLLSSLQAGLLILIVLGVLRLVGGRLDPRWQCVLWLLVMIRLMLPWAPESRMSIHNGLVHLVALRSSVQGVETPARVTESSSGATDVATGSGPAEDAEMGLRDAGAAAPVERGSEVAAVDWRSWFWPLAWLIGAGLAGSLLVWNQLALWRAVRGRRPVTDGAILDLLEDCKERMGVRTLLAIVPTERMQTPALYGIIRPRLLVPSAMLNELPREQLRHVLLHELAHLKRMDIHLGWLAAILQVLHWFNPLVWLAVAQMRVARELASDQKVLVVLHPEESQSYGNTILNLLEYWTAARRIPGMAGILEERSQLKRRINMIANHDGRRRMGSAVAIILAAGLIMVGLTNAQVPAGAAKTETAAPSPAPSPVPTPAPSPGAVAKEVVVRYEDDESDGKWSLATSGHGIEFRRPGNTRFVEAIEIFASRYGADEAPKEFFHAYILNQDRQVLADIPFAYGLIQKGDAKWYRLRTPSVEVPESFMIALSFDPHQTKGIYLHYSNTETPHSFTGLPDDGYTPVDKKYDWMVRAIMFEAPSGQKGTKLLKDWKPRTEAGPFGGCVSFPAKLAPTPDKQSYGGSGPAIELTVDPSKVGNVKLLADDIMVKGFSLYASRYGAGFDPQTTMVHVMVLDAGKEVRWQGEVPYSAFGFSPKWVNVVLPEPKPLSELAGKDNKLTVAFDPEAHQTKGIYFHYQKNPAKSHSLVGTLERGFRPVGEREWLIQVHVQPKSGSSR